MIIGCLYLSIIIIIIILELTFFYLVLFFIKWLYIDLLNFLFCKYISSHPTSICPKLVLLPWTLMFTLSISLNKFLLVEIQGMKQLTYLVIMDFTFKTCICAWYKKSIKSIVNLWEFVTQVSVSIKFVNLNISQNPSAFVSRFP